jgi:hypothetical protein
MAVVAGVPSRGGAQSVQGSIAVSLTVVQPATLAPYELDHVTVARDGTVSVTGGAAARSATSLIVMTQLVRDGKPTGRYEPAARHSSAYTGTNRVRTTAPRIPADTMQLSVRQVIFAGT